MEKKKKKKKRQREEKNFNHISQGKYEASTLFESTFAGTNQEISKYYSIQLSFSNKIGDSSTYLLPVAS